MYKASKYLRNARSCTEYLYFGINCTSSFNLASIVASVIALKY